MKPRSSSDLSGLYHLGRTLGRGHFAVVKLARHVDTGQLVAVKMIDKTKLDVMATSHLFQEVRYMFNVWFRDSTEAEQWFVKSGSGHVHIYHSHVWHLRLPL